MTVTKFKTRRGWVRQHSYTPNKVCPDEKIFGERAMSPSSSVSLPFAVRSFLIFCSRDRFPGSLNGISITCCSESTPFFKIQLFPLETNLRASKSINDIEVKEARWSEFQIDVHTATFMEVISIRSYLYSFIGIYQNGTYLVGTVKYLHFLS